MGIVVSSMWLHILTPVQNAILVVSYGFLTQGYAIWKLRHALSWRKVAPFIVGSGIGVPIGTLLLLLLRAALSQMDAPTRSSYVMAVVTPPERPAAASITSAPRALAAAASPAIAGALLAAAWQAWPLVICGVLNILFDLALLWTFRHIEPPEERG